MWAAQTSLSDKGKHVTRHTSHVTRHTSHVTRHTSHVTHHTSHITRHTSHITRLQNHCSVRRHHQVKRGRGSHAVHKHIQGALRRVHNKSVLLAAVQCLRIERRNGRRKVVQGFDVFGRGQLVTQFRESFLSFFCGDDGPAPQLQGWGSR